MKRAEGAAESAAAATTTVCVYFVRGLSGRRARAAAAAACAVAAYFEGYDPCMLNRVKQCCVFENFIVKLEYR